MKLRMSALLLLVALLSGLTTLSGRRAYGQDPGTTTPIAGQGEYAAMSADGRYVAFESAAADVVSGDRNGVRDVFVHDRESGETRRVSVASDGTEADGNSIRPAISADGRYVTFVSSAGNLVADDRSGYSDVFVHDRVTGETTRVSVASDGSQANAESERVFPGPSISGNGQFVAFSSTATNLTRPDDNNHCTEDGFAGGAHNCADVFVHDRHSGETTVVSVAPDGSLGNGPSRLASLSADGRYVAFESDATNLAATDTNRAADVFVHDRASGQTVRVSVGLDGGEANAGAVGPSISADGRYVAFRSRSNNLVPDDTNATDDIFVYDRQTGSTTRVSVASDGTQGNGPSVNPTISPDGSSVVFESFASNLGPADTNGTSDVYVHDRDTSETERASVTMDGGLPNGLSLCPAISGDGRYVVFESLGTNLGSNTRLFVRDRGPTVLPVHLYLPYVQGD